MNSSKYTDSNYSEDEGLEDYKIDGYHPVHVGEILLDRYVIMQKLGYGHFSTAWLALDNNNGNYVAIKIQKSDERYIQGAYDEIEILQALAKKNFDKEWIESLKEYYKDDKEKLKELTTVEHTQVVQLLNSFIHNGQNGKHFCMVFEVMGVTLLEIIKRYNYKGIPLPLVRIITKQILIGLDFLHRICHIIHTDMKPENVLVCLTQDELRNIQETGTYVLDTGNNNINSANNSHIISDEEKNKEKDKEKIIETSTNEFTMDENNNMEITIDKELGFKAIGKKARKKRQKYKKKKKKLLEKYGLSNAEIEEKMNKVMDDINEEIEKEQIELNIKNYDIEDLIERPRVASVPKVNLELKNYDIEDLIERPRVASVPKVNLELNSRKKSNEIKPKKNNLKLTEENSEESDEPKDDDYDEDELREFLESTLPRYDINLLEYSKSIQAYIKERNRILHDEKRCIIQSKK